MNELERQSGAVVKSYIVRARRPDNRWVKVRVIPYFGELRVPDFRYTGHARIRRPETTPRELVERMMRTVSPQRSAVVVRMWLTVD